MLVIAFPLAFAVAGLIFYWLGTPDPAKPKIARVGEIFLFCGLIWLVYLLAHGALKI